MSSLYASVPNTVRRAEAESWSISDLAVQVYVPSSPSFTLGIDRDSSSFFNLGDRYRKDCHTCSNSTGASLYSYSYKNQRNSFLEEEYSDFCSYELPVCWQLLKGRIFTGNKVTSTQTIWVHTFTFVGLGLKTFPIQSTEHSWILNQIIQMWLKTFSFNSKGLTKVLHQQFRIHRLFQQSLIFRDSTLVGVSGSFMARRSFFVPSEVKCWTSIG